MEGVLLSWTSYQFARAAHLGSLHNRNLFPHSSGGWKSEIKALAGLVFPEAFLLGSQMAAVSLCLHEGPSVCVLISH